MAGVAGSLVLEWLLLDRFASRSSKKTLGAALFLAAGAAGVTMGAGRTMDGPSCAWAGSAAKTTAADSMKAATRIARRPNMVHTVAIQPPAVKVCSDQVVCLPLRSMGS